jgi:hypothetical protein
MPAIRDATGIIFKITQKMPKQRTGKAWRQIATTGRGGSANAKVQNIQHGK